MQDRKKIIKINYKGSAKDEIKPSENTISILKFIFI